MKNNFNKIVSLDEKVRGIKTLLVRDLAWPCVRFQVALQAAESSELNPFELLLLRLIDQKITETDRLSEISCLDMDLVRFIRDRLTQLDLIDENQELSKVGRNILRPENDNNSKGTKNNLPIIAYVYVDKISGQLLTAITKEVSLDTLRNVNGGWEIEKGTAGTAKKIKVKCIRDSSPYEISAPDENSVLRMLMAFNRKRKQSVFLSSKASELLLESVPDTHIKVESVGQDVFLHVKAFLQQGSTDFVVTDGFGLGFSQQFSSGLESIESEWLSKIKKSALDKMQNIKVDKRSDNQFDLALKKHYPDLGVAIERAELSYNKLIHSKEVIKTKDFRPFVTSLYASYEYALKMVWQAYPVENPQAFLQVKNEKEQQSRLISYLKHLGFKVKPHLKKSLVFSPAQLDRVKNGEGAELQALIALNLVSAMKNSGHPFRGLRELSANALNRMTDLKGGRDQASHGQEMVNLPKEKISALREMTYEAIGVLVPEVCGYLPSEVLQNKGSLKAGQSKLLATIELEKEFDVFDMNSMTPTIKELLIESEQYLQDLDLKKTTLIDATYWISSIANLFQNSLHNQSRKKQLRIPRKELRIRASKIAKEAGFILDQNKLPGSINTVALRRIEMACSGMSSTLGAQLLGWIITLDDFKLASIAQSMPNFLIEIEKILDLRGHNNQSCYLSGLNISENKEIFYRMIRFIL